MPPRSKAAQKPKAQPKASQSQTTTPQPPQKQTKAPPQPKKERAPPKAQQPRAPPKPKKTKEVELVQTEVEAEVEVQDEPSQTQVESQVESQVEERERVPFSLQTYESRIDQLLGRIDTQISSLKETGDKGTKFYKSVRKELNWLRKNAPRLSKQRTRRTTDDKQNIQFNREVEVTPELRKFLKVKDNTPLSRNDVTNALCAYVNVNPEKPSGRTWGSVMNPGNKRNLQKEGNGMLIEPDSALKKLLRYEQYVKDVKSGKIMCTKTVTDDHGVKRRTKVVQEDPTLKYCVMNKLVNQHHILSTKPLASVSTPQVPQTQPSVEETTNVDDLDDLELEE